MSERDGAALRAMSYRRLVPLPAPVGGWNARSPLEAMKADEAITLENRVATPEGVVLRMGKRGVRDGPRRAGREPDGICRAGAQ